MSAAALTCFALALALAGCGSVSTTASKSSASPGIEFEGKRATLELASPALTNGGALPAAFTCDGADVEPPLSWGPVPSDTKELALFLLGFKRTGKGGLKAVLAMAGLSPTIHAIEAGATPKGAILGRSGGGRSSSRGARYSICPKRGTSEGYLFLLYALPSASGVHAGFAAEKLLERINSSSTSTPFGALISSYTRA